MKCIDCPDYRECSRKNDLRRLRHHCEKAKIKIADKNIPTEAEEQRTLFNWADMQSYKYPELELLYHVPNGGSRNKLEAANLQKQGVKPGVPDICLPVPRGKYHGLYIELKRVEGGKLSENQKKWLQALAQQGYKSLCCEGWKEASEEILAYLSLGGQSC